MAKKRVTMDDIAASLNVSKSLVSRALSNKYGVSDETRFRILVEAAKLGYNFGTSAGASKKIDSVTVVMLYAQMNEGSYFSTVLEGIEEALSKKNIACKIKFLEADENNIDYPVPFWRLDTSGVIVLGYITDENLRSLSATGYPMVLAENQNEFCHTADRVMVNNHQGAFAATRYLLDKGYKHLMFVGASDVGLGFSERCRGFCDCMRSRNDPALRFERLSSPAPARQPVNEEELSLRLSQPDLPDAILCANDIVAVTAVKILRARGVRVPEDVAVLGFDNTASRVFEPAVSTVDVPKKEIGRRAVEMLLRRIENPAAPVETVLLNTALILRQTA